MEHTVHLRDLGVSSLTWPRGREAYRHLRERWRDGSLTLLLDDMNMLSLPFLVGLVLQLLAAGKRERTTRMYDRSDDPITLDEIERVNYGTEQKPDPPSVVGSLLRPSRHGRNSF